MSSSTSATEWIGASQRDALAMRLEHQVGLGGHGRVLDERVRESLGHAAVEVEVGRRVALGAVVGLEVDGDDRVGRGELGDQLVGPVARRIELEAQVLVELEPAVDLRGARRVAQAGRDHEGDRLGLTSDELGERDICLAQREVERRALVGPAAMRVGHVEHVRVALERPRARERKDRASRLFLVVVLGVPGDVLSDALLAAGPKVHDGRDASEPARDRPLQPLELVRVDFERKLCEALP